MWHDKEELLFDLVTRDAILVWNGEIYRLDGPFASRTHASEAAEELKLRVSDNQVSNAA